MVGITEGGLWICCSNEGQNTEISENGEFFVGIFMSGWTTGYYLVEQGSDRGRPGD